MISVASVEERRKLLRWARWGMLLTSHHSAAWIKRGVITLYMLGMVDYREIGITYAAQDWRLTDLGRAELMDSGLDCSGK